MISQQLTAADIDGRFEVFEALQNHVNLGPDGRVFQMGLCVAFGYVDAPSDLIRNLLNLQSRIKIGIHAHAILAAGVEGFVESGIV